MNNYQQLYWLTRLDSIQSLCITILIFVGLFILIVHIVAAVEAEWTEHETIKKWRTLANKGFYFLIPAILLLTFLPSKDEVIFIYAGGKTMDFIQEDSSINKIPAQTTKLITDYLDNKIKETKK
jgi:regulator of protease activity HflC (stomatin/prohibitin superfamily)